jgi:hypothetical protein
VLTGVVSNVTGEMGQSVSRVVSNRTAVIEEEQSMSDPDSWCDGLVGFERPRYFQGKLLVADDLRQEQTYHRHKHAAHTRAMHGDGTVCGLAVRPTNPPSRDLVVEPGVAVDCCGREIVVPSPQTLCLDEAAAGGVVGQLAVTLRLAEVATDPAPVVTGPEAGDALQPGSIRESFELELSDLGGLDLGRHRRLLVPSGSARVGLEGLHEVLVQRVLRPCEPCLDQRVPLATVSLPMSGPVTAEAIDNSVRPIVLTADLVDFLLAELLRQRQTSPTWWARLRRALGRN